MKQDLVYGFLPRELAVVTKGAASVSKQVSGDDVLDRLRAAVRDGDWPLLEDVQRGFELACTRNFAPGQSRDRVKGLTYREGLNPWKPVSAGNPSWVELFGAASPDEDTRRLMREARSERQRSLDALQRLGKVDNPNVSPAIATSKAMTTAEGRAVYQKYLEAGARLQKLMRR